MKRVNVLKLIVFALCLTLFFSCSKSDDKSGNSPIKSIQVDATSYEKWVYFSFEKGVIGTYGDDFDYKNNLDWDIAFHKWDVRTNSGESGKGNGGAYSLNFENLNVKEWGDVKPADDKFVVDELMMLYMTTPDMNADVNAEQRTLVGANKELGQWMTVITNPMPPTYTMKETAFIVRTAKGKYAAIRFIDYTDDKAKKGFPKIEYVYPVFE